MTEALLLGLLILALAGWSACLILFARSILPMMNAFKVMHVVDDLFDKRINAVLDRARAKQPVVHVPDGKPENAREKIQSEIQSMFGGGPLIAPEIFGEQPDPQDVETVSA